MPNGSLVTNTHYLDHSYTQCFPSDGIAIKNEKRNVILRECLDAKRNENPNFKTTRTENPDCKTTSTENQDCKTTMTEYPELV